MLIHANASSASTSPFLLRRSGIILTALQYGTLQFGKFEDIQKDGYRAAMEFLEKWDEEGLLPSPLIGDKTTARASRR